MPRNFLILSLNAWVRVQVTFFPHFVVRKKSTGAVTKMNMYSSCIFVVTVGMKCVLKVKNVTYVSSLV
jgi:hypothetical protein